MLAIQVAYKIIWNSYILNEDNIVLSDSQATIRVLGSNVMNTRMSRETDQTRYDHRTLRRILEYCPLEDLQADE